MSSRRKSLRPGGPRRVVVVGAGHNGLLCAARLAAAGLEVTVLDQAGQPGGAVRSEELAPGYTIDVGAAFVPLAAASPAFADVPLERHGVEWIDPAVAMVHPFLDGQAISLHRDLDATCASLDASATGAGQAWRALVEPLIARRKVLLPAALSPFPPPPVPAARLALGLRRQGVELARMMLGSAASMGLDVFGDARAAAWLTGSTLHSDLTPGSAGGAAFGFFLHVLGHLVGWPYPRGGAGRLTDALVAHVAEVGGELRCNASVESIEVRAGRVRGVRLRSGEGVAADAVVSTVTAAPLARMLPDGALAERLMRRLRRWRYGLGTLKIDLALDGPVPWTNHEARSAAVVHVGGELDALFRAPEEAGHGRVPSAPVLVVGQQSVHDPTRAPAGRHTLYIYTHVPQRPDLPDDALADRVEEQIERFAPGFRSLVTARRMRSPADLEVENPSLVGGDLGGGSFEVDQQLVFRPAPELFRYRAPLPGLYVAGASTHPGGGVHGVSGRGAADMLLRDRWSRPWR